MKSEKDEATQEGRQLLGLGLNPQMGFMGLGGLGGLNGLGGLGGFGGFGGTSRLALMIRLQQIQRLNLLQSLAGNNRIPNTTPGIKRKL